MRARLKPGGTFAQRIDTHALAPEDFDLLAATFHAVFPHMQVWTPAPGNLILLGARDSLGWDYRRVARHFAETKGVAEDLESAGIWHPFALFGAQILGENESEALARDTREVHTDDRPVLEFRTPRSLYVETTPMIVHALDYYARTRRRSRASIPSTIWTPTAPTCSDSLTRRWGGPTWPSRT